MAEICKDCFMKEHPEIEEEKLILFGEPDLCEVCGEVKLDTVIKIKGG